MGAWISYGLGSMNQNLPTFVVLPDSRGFAPNGPGNWTAGFLPAAHQGTMIRASSPNPIYDLFPPKSAAYITPQSEADSLHVLNEINRQHLASASRTIPVWKRASRPMKWRRSCRSARRR